MKKFECKKLYAAMAASAAFSLACAYAQESPEGEVAGPPEGEAASASGQSGAAADALGGLPFSGVAAEDLRPFEKRHLVREIIKRLSECAEVAMALAGRLDEVGYQDLDGLLAEKFAFAGASAGPSSGTPSSMRDLLAPKPAAVAAAEMPAIKTTRTRRRAESKDSNEMPVISESGVFDAKEGILIAKGATSAATAFVAEINGKNFIVTNLHVVTDKDISFWTVNGDKVDAPDVGYAASDRDLYIMPLYKVPRGVNVLKISESILADAKDGDDVLVCGNAQGGGVLLVSHGAIVAVGPDMIETDCVIFKGNSGSPMYHRKSGKIIGVISHSKIRDDELSRMSMSMSNSPIKSQKRDFGVRMDSVKDWLPLTPAEASVQAAELEGYLKKARYAGAFFGNGVTPAMRNDYPEFERIVGKAASSGAFGRGSGRYSYRNSSMEKVVVGEMLGEISRLLNNDLTRLRVRKFNGAFQGDVEYLVEVFTQLKESYSNEARRMK